MMDIVGKDFFDGFDVVIFCLLEGVGMVDVFDVCVFGGCIVMYGCIGFCEEFFDFFKMYKKCVDIYFIEFKCDIDMCWFWQEGLQLVEDGFVNIVEMVIYCFLLEKVGEVFILWDDKLDCESIYVLIDCW